MRIVFDFDGTIADSMPELQELAIKLIVKNYEVSDETAFLEYRDTIGLSFREQLDEIFPYDSRNDRVAAEFHEQQAGVYETVGIFADAYEALEIAQDGGASLAICSSSAASLTWPVIKGKLDGYHFLITGREYGPKLAQLKRLTAGETWFIGDAIMDGYLARKAGVGFMGVTHTFTTGDFDAEEFASQADLPAAVSKVLGAVKETQ